jgi:hypothetical protein
MMHELDWAMEDTEVGPDADARPQGRRPDPSYELLWVEEDGLGMVLRVRRVATP